MSGPHKIDETMEAVISYQMIHSVVGYFLEIASTKSNEYTAEAKNAHAM